MPKTKHKLTNFLVLIFTILIFIIILEITSYFIYSKNQIKTELIKSTYIEQNDEYYGYILKPDSSYNAVKKTEEIICYNVTYYTDEYGRRTVFQDYGNEKHLVLFGGSVTYGEGLSNNETLQKYLENKFEDYNIYNYAIHGYGPSHMLAKLESEKLSSEINSNEGLAFFVFIPAHINRVIGNTLAWWLYDSPYYVLENNEIKRKGSFETSRPVITKIYKGFLKIKENSYFLRLINLNLPLWSSKKDIEITGEVITKAKELYETHTNGKFVVVFHPEWNRTKDKRGYNEFLNFFEEKNLTILDYSGYLYGDDKIIPCDLHPKGILNQDLADLIYEDSRKLGIV